MLSGLLVACGLISPSWIAAQTTLKNESGSWNTTYKLVLLQKDWRATIEY
jgi:hypothetical protein